MLSKISTNNEKEFSNFLANILLPDPIPQKIFLNFMYFIKEGSKNQVPYVELKI